MKFVSVLVAFQTVLIVMLFIKIDSYETRVAQSAKSPGALESTAPAVKSPPDSPVVENPGLTSGQLRRILREELNAITLSNESMPENAGSGQDAPGFDDVEMQYRRDLIVEKLELLKAQGDVSTGELDNLMSEIARLDPERRTAMMNMLNVAMNRGEIRGHF